MRLPIFYNALLLTGVNLLLRLVSTSFQVFLSGHIGAEGIGLLQLVMSVGMLSMTAGMAGVRTATMYLTAEELGKRRRKNVRWVLSGSFTYSIVCSGCLCLGLFFFAPYLAQHWIGDLQTLGAIRLYACFVPISCLCGVMTGYFTADNRIGTLAAVEIAEQLCSMAVTFLALLFWAGKDAGKACQSVVLGGGAGSCITLICLMILYLRKRQISGAPIPIGRRLLKAAVPLALADDLKAGISTTENLMVPKRLAHYPGTQAPLAAFGTVTGMVFPVLMFPAAILFGLAELLIPELARCAAAGSQRRICYLVKRSVRISMLYGCFFAGQMILLAQPLCRSLYQSETAGEYLQMYAFLIPMLYCDAITDAMTKGLGQQTACVRYNILTSSMDVAGLYLLLPRMGMDGYFLSFLITHLLNFLLSMRRLLKITGLTLRLRPVILTACSTAAGVFSAGFVNAPAGRAFCFVTVYFSCLFLMGVVGKEDVSWLRGLLMPKNATG